MVQCLLRIAKAARSTSKTLVHLRVYATSVAVDSACSASMPFISHKLLLYRTVLTYCSHQKTLCNGDHERPLKIDIYDWDRDGSHDYMVSVTTSLSALLNLDGGRQVNIVTAFFKHLRSKELYYMCTLAVQPLNCSSIIVIKCSGHCVIAAQCCDGKLVRCISVVAALCLVG
jgi:hypothetical protein